MLITQNHLGDGTWVFCYQYYCRLYPNRISSYGYVFTLTWGFNEKWSGFVENQGFKGYSDAIVRGGAIFE
jgi:hypothetical protein